MIKHLVNTLFFALILSSTVAQADSNKKYHSRMTDEQARAIVGEKVSKLVQNKGRAKLDEGKKLLNPKTLDAIQDQNKSIEEAFTQESENHIANAQNMNAYNDKRLFIFISSSMPPKVIRNLITSSSKVKTETVFVLKGFVDGIKKIKPTIHWVQKILCSDEPPGSEKCLGASINIDPSVFDEFEITSVPSILYLPQGHTPCNCTGPTDIDNEKPAYLSHGDASLFYHLTKMSEHQGPHQEEIRSFTTKLTTGFFR